MPNGPGDPKECRQYAAHCRELADQTNDPLLQKAYLDLAQSWSRLADELERVRISTIEIRAGTETNRMRGMSPTDRCDFGVMAARSRARGLR